MFVGAESFAADVRERPLHALQARGGRDDAAAASSTRNCARMSEIADADRDRRPAALQRVLRGDERARGLGDRPPGDPRVDRGGRQGRTSSRTCTSSRTASSARTAPTAPLPARPATARRPAHRSSVGRGRAAAHELRRRLVPPDLRRRFGGGERRPLSGSPALRCVPASACGSTKSSSIASTADRQNVRRRDGPRCSIPRDRGRRCLLPLPRVRPRRSCRSRHTVRPRREPDQAELFVAVRPCAFRHRDRGRSRECPERVRGDEQVSRSTSAARARTPSSSRLVVSVR